MVEIVNPIPSDMSDGDNSCQRTRQRYRCRVETDALYGRVRSDVECENLSEGGVGLRVSGEVEIDIEDILELTLVVDGVDERINVIGEVRWVAEDGDHLRVGVEFLTKLTANQVEGLNGLEPLDQAA